MIIIAICSFIFYFTQAQITITGSKDQIGLPQQQITFSIANFGDIPYGMAIQGFVQNSDPFDSCQPLQNTFINENHKGKIFLVKRGNCTFVSKVFNIQQHGGILAIIIDNIKEETSMITMADDGYGSKIHIPSIFISELDGDYLEKLIKGEQKNNNSLYISVIFPVNVTQNLDLQLYLNPPQQENYVFLHQLYKNRFQLLKDKVSMKIIYQIDECYDCSYNNKSLQNCYGNGKYCAIDPDGPGIATGQHILNEYLKQLCIFKLNGEVIWYQYFTLFGENCAKPQTFDSCGKQLIQFNHILNLIDLDNVMECVENSFLTKTGKTKTEQNNTILQEQMKLIDASYIITWPAVVINNVTYKGSLKGDDVLELMCSSLKQTTKECQYFLNYGNLDDYVDDYSTESGINVLLLVVIILVSLCIIFAIVMIIYKRKIKNELPGQISQKVNELVSNYIKFYDQDNKKKKNLQDSQQEQIDIK